MSLLADGEAVEVEVAGMVTVVSFRHALSLAALAMESLSAVEPVCRLMVVLPDHDTTSLHV